MSWIDDLGTVRAWQDDGTSLPAQSKANAIGSLKGVDNPSSKRTDLYVRTLKVTELTTNPGAYDGQHQSCDGYTTRGDGGGGELVWDSSSTATVDGGTIFGTGTGRWKRVYTGFASPKWFGAKGDGSTDDTAAIRACVLACDQVDWGDSTYIVSKQGSDGANDPILALTSRTGVHWRGRGATIKVTDNEIITGFREIVELTSCNYCTFEDIILDGNRQNRPLGSDPAIGSGSTPWNIVGGGHLYWYRCRVQNSTWDSWYVRASSPATEATYPTDIYLIDCESYLARRNGISIIGGKRIWMRGGRWYGTTGDPGAGILLEPNAGDTYGVEDVWISDVEVSDNEGEGINLAAGNSSVQPRRIQISNIRGRANTAGLILIGACDDVTVDGVYCSDDTAAITNAGMVQVNTGCSRIALRNLSFREVTCGSTSKYLVFVDDTNTVNTVENLQAYACSCRVLAVTSSAKVSGVVLESCTSDQCLTLSTGVQSLTDVYAVSCTGNVVLAGGTVNRLSDITVDEPPTAAQGMRVTGGRTVIRDVTVYESGNAAGAVYPIYFDNAATIDALENIYCKAAGTDYTRTNTIRLPTSVAGARVRNVSPNPFANSATWDPGSLASGASVTSSSITITGAELGDPVRTSHSVDLQGLVSTGYVSATNTVVVVLSNLTGGAVDLGSHTVTAEVVK